MREMECWDGRNELGFEQGHAGTKEGECWDQRLNVISELGNAGMYNQRCFYLLLACDPVGVVLSCG